MEIVARRLAAALPGERIESVMTPGINALKTFDPPLSALDGATFRDVRRRGKLLLLEAETDSHGPLTLLTHLMSAGRMMLYEKRASMKDRTSRVLVRLPGDRELRVREFGTKQAAWIKLLTLDGLEAEPSLKTLGPEAWPDPPALERAALDTAPAALAAARPAGDLGDRADVGRRDPARREALAVQARRRPVRARGGGAARGDGLRARPRPRRLRGEGRPPAAGEVPEADAGPRPPGRAVPAVRDRPRGRVLRGLRDDVLPALPDRRPDPQGPAAFQAS